MDALNNNDVLLEMEVIVVFCVLQYVCLIRHNDTLPRKYSA